LAILPTKRTGHYGGPWAGGHPCERLYRAVAKAISAEAKAKGITLEDVVEQRIPDAFRFVARRNRSKPFVARLLARALDPVSLR
jgi:hypothetical protein